MQNNGGARPQPTLIWTHLAQRSATQPRSSTTVCRSHSQNNEDKWKECWRVNGVAYWTLVGDPVRTRGPSCEVIQAETGFYTPAGVAPWVVHSQDSGQLISCHTCTHISNICEIIFGFPSHSLCPAFGPDCLLGPKTQEKHVKISKIALQNQWECVTIPRGQTCVSFYFIRFIPLAAWQNWFICDLFQNDSQKTIYCVFWEK